MATPDGGNLGESPRLLLNDTTGKTPYNARKYHGVSHGNMFSPPTLSMGGLNDSTLVASGNNQQGGDDSEIWLGEKPLETTVRETGLY